MVKPINQKVADRIMERIELEEKLIEAFNAGKYDRAESDFKIQIKQWLDRRYPDLEIN